MKHFQKFVFAGILTLLIPVLYTPAYSKSPSMFAVIDESKTIIKKICEKHIPLFKKYDGVEAIREVVIKEYDPSNNKLLNTSELTLKVREHYYKVPEITVVSFTKNGEKMKPTEYKPKDGKPGVPVFDEKGEENYKTLLVGYKKINGHDTYKIKVIPKKKGLEYFSGNFYFRKDTLDLVFMEGIVEKLPYPLKEFKLDINLELAGEVSVLSTCQIILRAYVPIIQPDRRIITDIKAIKTTPVLKKQLN